MAIVLIGQPPEYCSQIMAVIPEVTEPGYIAIPMRRKGWKSVAYLGVLNAGDGYQPEMEKCLHASERETLNGYWYKPRKRNFLSGRFVAKKVLAKFLKEPDLTKIIIKPGIFNQPLLSYTTSNPPGFSISHSLSYTSCLVFPQEHPMGIDIETSANHAAAQDITSQLTDREKTMIKYKGLPEYVFHIKLWTIKEALSKVLKTGLTAPLEIYEIAEIHRDNYFYFSTFKNFAQYKAITFSWRSNICSFVLPQKTKCDLDNLIAYINR